MGKAQAAIEFLGIALVGVLLFVPLFFIATDFLGSRSFETALGQARQTSSAFASVADSMCLQPQGSKTEAVLAVPSFLDPATSNITGKTIKFNLTRGDRVEVVTATSRCDVNGTVPSAAGTYIFEIKREATLVNITRKV